MIRSLEDSISRRQYCRITKLKDIIKEKKYYFTIPHTTGSFMYSKSYVQRLSKIYIYI